MLKLIVFPKCSIHRSWPDVTSFPPLICKGTSESLRNVKKHILASGLIKLHCF